MLISNKELQEAMKEGRFIAAKKDGKLTKVKPQVGWTVILEDSETAEVLRFPNSVGDFTVRTEYGDIVRKNLCNQDILGYLK